MDGKMVRPGTSSAISDMTTTTDTSDSSTTNGSDVGLGINISKMEKANNGGVVDDVAQVYILQPTEIMKNIDLMRTVAILMENRLQASSGAVTKTLDENKLKDLYGDVERFPEAFNKFISIIHQVQYLNVTSDWNFTTNGEIAASASGAKRGSILAKLWNSRKRLSNGQYADLNVRKEVMLNLLSSVQQVFNRYLKLQTALVERANRFHELLRAKEQEQDKRVSNAASDSDDDDPNMPLLVQRQSRNNTKIWLQRVEMLQSTLKKTQRSAGEVQDSMDVLRDLINWDYKQALAPPNVAPWPRPPSSVNFSTSSASQSFQNGSGHARAYQSIGEMNSDRASSARPQTNSHSHSQQNPVAPGRRKRLCILSAILAVVIVLLVIVSALSFLRFSY